jgi:hypothetical protein
MKSELVVRRGFMIKAGLMIRITLVMRRGLMTRGRFEGMRRYLSAL